MTAVNDNPSVSDAPRPVVASPLIRLLAVLYDGMLLLALVVFVGAILVIAATSGEQARSGHAVALSASFRYGVMFPAFVLTVWGFYGLFWTRIGQTLGMQTWRLKTVRPDGRLLDWPTALLRCAMACVLPLICALAGYWLHHTAEALVIAAHAGDHTIYPDCREPFMQGMAAAMREGTYARVELLRPFIQLDKAGIAKLGASLRARPRSCSSCYGASSPGSTPGSRRGCSPVTTSISSTAGPSGCSTRTASRPCSRTEPSLQPTAVLARAARWSTMAMR